MRVYVIKSRLCLLSDRGKEHSVNKGTGDGGRGDEKMWKDGEDRLLGGWLDG